MYLDDRCERFSLPVYTSLQIYFLVMYLLVVRSCFSVILFPSCACHSALRMHYSVDICKKIVFSLHLQRTYEHARFARVKGASVYELRLFLFSSESVVLEFAGLLNASKIT